MEKLTLGYYLYAILVGLLGGMHIPINGALGARINSTLLATFIFFGIAFFLASIALIVKWDQEAFRALGLVPKWYYLAGVISVIVVSSGTFLVTKIGAINLFVLILSSQLITRSIISHFGWLESPVSPISWIKVLGAVFLVVGALLVVKKW